MLTRHRITQRADRDGVGAIVVERDYVLAHVVAQLPGVSLADGGRLVLKGGTALRLLHVGEYRYSADLDFTVIDGSAEEALAAIGRALAAAKAHAGLPRLEFADSARPAIEYVGPLAGKEARRIKVDLSTDEYVETTEQFAIQPLWGDLPEIGLANVYSLDEIAAEKLRCIIQRLQCRDLFDLFYLVDQRGIDLADVAPLFHRKVQAKRIDPTMFARRFNDRLPEYTRRWTGEMSEHLPRDPLDIDHVIRVVTRKLRRAGLLT